MILSKMNWYHFRLLFLPLVMFLASCNLFSPSPQPDPGLNVTQAYQTIEARLTEAVALTPQITNTSPGDDNGFDTPVVTTPPLSPTPPPTEQPTTPTATQLCDHAAPGSPIDVTIPDDSIIEANQAFTKTWRLQNIGTCTWNESYSLVWFSGDQLGAPSSIPFQATVPPGSVVDVSVDMAAPDEPGTFSSHWKLRNPGGVLFGIGPNADSSFWVRIQVVEPIDTTPSPTETETPVPTPTETVEPFVSGRVTLNLDDRLDLDSLQVNSGYSEDVSLSRINQVNYLEPFGSAALAVFGDTRPSLLECQGQPLSADPLTIQDLTPGVYLCYLTNMALPGWARIEFVSTDPVRLEMELYTWEVP